MLKTQCAWCNRYIQDGKATTTYLCTCGVTFDYACGERMHYSTCLYPTATKDLDASHGICETCLEKELTK